VAVYAGILLTGIPTVWYHGFGETNVSGWADSSSNLLLAWLVQVAALWDAYGEKTKIRVATVSGIINLAVVFARGIAGESIRHIDVIPLGEFGGFHITEAMLILDSLLAAGLLYGQLREIPRKARNLLYAVTAIFVVGMLLATASNHQLDFQIVSYHALWHSVGSFGFVFLWVFNHVRWNMTDN
jgi:hypothetical protein